MTLLINRTDFSDNNRQITQSNFNSGTLSQHISDAQFVDEREGHVVCVASTNPCLERPCSPTGGGSKIKPGEPADGYGKD